MLNRRKELPANKHKIPDTVFLFFIIIILGSIYVAGASDVNNSSETASIQVDPTVDSTIGDVNRDGAVNLGDGIYLANYILRVIGYEEIDEEAADIDGNGLVNLEDALYLINHELFVPEYDTFY